MPLADIQRAIETIDDIAVIDAKLAEQQDILFASSIPQTADGPNSSTMSAKTASELIVALKERRDELSGISRAPGVFFL